MLGYRLRRVLGYLWPRMLGCRNRLGWCDHIVGSGRGLMLGWCDHIVGRGHRLGCDHIVGRGHRLGCGQIVGRLAVASRRIVSVVRGAVVLVTVSVGGGVVRT